MNSSTTNKSKWLEPVVSRSCPLCGSVESHVISGKMQHNLDLTTVICQHCSFVFTNPVPTEETYNRFYQEAYADYYGHIAGRFDKTASAKIPKSIAVRIEFIQSVASLDGSRLMELGPGKGQFLYWAKQYGANIIGVEPSRAFHEMLLQNKLPSINTTLEALEPSPYHAYDIIVMSHVLEHFYDPNEALRHIRQLLVDKGILAVIVPDILRPYRSLDRYFLRYVHPSNFSPVTLRALLSKHGFEVIKATYEGSRWYEPQSQFVIARKRVELPNQWQEPKGHTESVIRTLKYYRLRWNLVFCWAWHGRLYMYRLKHLVFRAAHFIKNWTFRK